MLKTFARRLSSFLLSDVVQELRASNENLRQSNEQLRQSNEQIRQSNEFLGVLANSQKNTAEKLWILEQRSEGIYGAADQLRSLTITQLKLLKMQTLGAEPIISFAHNGSIPIKLYVPKAATDYIQGHHLFHEDFWESTLLEKMKSFTKGKAILDIGANVGNHVVYWTRVAGAKSVKAFEPIPELFDILQRNIELNGIHNAEAFDVALGKEKSFGQPVSHASNRMQSEIFASEDNTGIKIVALDDMDVAEADFAKIDVEGHTLDLLHGAGKTLARLKPALFVELFEHEKDACVELLERIGYRMLQALEDNNYFFVHRDRPFDGELGFL